MLSKAKKIIFMDWKECVSTVWFSVRYPQVLMFQFQRLLRVWECPQAKLILDCLIRNPALYL